MPLDDGLTPPSESSGDRRENLAAHASSVLWQGYMDFRHSFETMACRACQNFEARDWETMRIDTVNRLDLYQKAVTDSLETLSDVLSDDLADRALWTSIKKAYRAEAQTSCEPELACTFYNSVNRRVFDTFGIDAELEFTSPVTPPRKPASALPGLTTLAVTTWTADVVQRLLAGLEICAPVAGLENDARLCAHRLDEQVPGPGRLDILQTPFFRETNAYYIGRWQGRCATPTPVVLVLHHGADGLRVDAVLTSQEQLRILFSFSRAYFHVKTGCAGDIVHFIKELMPQKRTAEIYISLGFHKHGKTELYHDLVKHRHVCGSDCFQLAQGQRGMVMIAFNMSRDDLIYKIIRDRFAQPKRTTRAQIMEKYDYVFRHDRAGRLVDVQSFENLEIEKCCFSPDLLEEIEKQASKTAMIGKDHVLLRHVYVERRVVPLDVYLKNAAKKQAQRIVIDYGQAIKDLACANVFAGDLLIKNFGVTRLGRVVFYDYDELCPLTDCRFKRLPPARRYEDELENRPWFLVNEGDVFPEEFLAFLGLTPELQKTFVDHHADLLTPEFWQQTQNDIETGRWTPILPYAEEQRLGRS